MDFGQQEGRYGRAGATFRRMDQPDKQSPVPTHERQPFMPIFWFGWRFDVPFFVLCVGLSGFMFGRNDWFAGAIATLLAGLVPVQGALCRAPSPQRKATLQVADPTSRGEAVP